jgi:hypothetical protein
MLYFPAFHGRYARGSTTAWSKASSEWTLEKSSVDCLEFLKMVLYFHAQKMAYKAMVLAKPRSPRLMAVDEAIKPAGCPMMGDVEVVFMMRAEVLAVKLDYLGLKTLSVTLYIPTLVPDIEGNTYSHFYASYIVATPVALLLHITKTCAPLIFRNQIVALSILVQLEFLHAGREIAMRDTVQKHGERVERPKRAFFRSQ